MFFHVNIPSQVSSFLGLLYLNLSLRSSSISAAVSLLGGGGGRSEDGKLEDTFPQLT